MKSGKSQTNNSSKNTVSKPSEGKAASDFVNRPKLSVIVPIYNTEKYLERCLESICKQSYKDMEIILVDDGSTDTSKEIITSFMQQDKRIISVSHEKNRGLFQARVTGVEKSQGEYIAFVDSDDTIGVDWFRLLVKKAEETTADIVMGNTICEDDKHYKYIYNTYYFAARSRKCLCGEEVLDSLMENEGMCFSKHTVWNKLYSRRIWEQSLPHFHKLQEHFIMTEDISFSVVLHYYAKKLAYSYHDGYFYFRNNESSTISVNGLNKIQKNVGDLKRSFSFVKEFLEEKKVFDRYAKNYRNLKERYFRWWSYSVQKNTEEKSKEAQRIKKDFLEFFEKKEFELPIEEDDCFTDVSTAWNDKYEQLKSLILDDAVKCVSFDIFDTLVVRPFLEPTDLYCFMEDDFKKMVPCNYSFKGLRAEAEQRCRKAMRVINPNSQDVTLSEIYEQMSKDFSIPQKICEQLQAKEEELEVRFCTVRKTGKELYELAYEAGKKIILVSDMYLEEKTIGRILEKNGYNLHEKLFLSSTERYLKYSGDLFRIALKECNIQPETMLHIGDNWNVDYLQPPKLGCKSAFLPKTKDVLFNALGDVYTGEAIGTTFYNANSLIDVSTIMKSPAVRALYAVVANEIFDNPFVSFNPVSNYNRDAYFVGYFTVGMHLLGLTRWMAKELRAGGYKKIHFLARDGYLPKKIYDVVREYDKELPESDYIYISRKSMIPATVRSEMDFYSIKENCSVWGQSPESIYNLYSDILQPLTEDMKDGFKKLGIIFDQKFTNEESFQFFIRNLIKLAYDKEKAEESFKQCSKYFSSKISKEDVTFDLGYSGKLQSAMCKALGYPVDALFLHSNGFEASRQAINNGYQIKAYYDFDVPLSGIVNEFIFSDYRPSCISYQEVNGETMPVFEEKEVVYQEKYLLNEIARGCENFVRNFYETFGEYLDLFQFRVMDTSLAYERFLTNSKWFDINLLKFCYLEDEYYGGISKKRMSDHWWWQMNNKGVFGSNMTPEQVQQMSLPVNEELDQMYHDGMFVAAYKKMNRMFPLGTKRRELVKKIGSKMVK